MICVGVEDRYHQDIYHDVYVYRVEARVHNSSTARIASASATISSPSLTFFTFFGAKGCLIIYIR